MSEVILFAYFSPETYLPVTSVIATVLGVVMMGGRTGLRLVVRGVRRALGRGERNTVSKGPHFGHVRRNETESRANRP